MDLRAIIEEKSAKYGVMAPVMASIIYQESKGNPFAMRFERAFFERLYTKPLSGYVPDKELCSLDTELCQRATSWGLGQMLGETARWFGKIKAPYLPALLLDPEFNVDICTNYFSYLLERHKNNPVNRQYWLALKDYNGSPAYPPRILDHVAKHRYLKMYGL